MKPKLLLTAYLFLFGMLCSAQNVTYGRRRIYNTKNNDTYRICSRYRWYSVQMK